MTPFPELNELIAAGWGHVRRDRIPQDWRERKAPRDHEQTTRKTESMEGRRKFIRQPIKRK